MTADDILAPSVPGIWPAPESRSFHGSFEIDLDDHLAIAYRSRDVLPAGASMLAVGLAALFAGVTMQFGLWQSGALSEFIIRVAGTVLSAMLAGFLLLKPARRGIREFYRGWLRRQGRIGQTVTTTVSRNGIRFSVRGQTVTCPWSSLHDLEEDDGSFYFWMSRMTAHPWPARMFASSKRQGDPVG